MKKIYFFLLLIMAAPGVAQITTPSPIYACGNGSPFATFDLTAHNSEMLNGANPASFTIRFYTTLANAGSNTDEIMPQTAYTNSNPFTEVIFVRIDDLVNSTMSIVELELVVSPAPTAVIAGNPVACGSDFASVVFTGSLGTGPYIFSYSVNGGPVLTAWGNASVGVLIPINGPGTYTLILQSVSDSSPQNCTTILNQPFDIVVSAPPVIGQPETMTVTEDPFDGIAAFDLTSQENAILNGQSGLAVSYFTTEAAAAGNFNALAFPQTFTNTVNPQQIWVRVENTGTGCYSLTNFYVFVNSATDPIVFIPDPVFKAYLTSGPNGYVLGASLYPIDVDLNHDGEVQLSETQAVYRIQLDVPGSIHTIEGINSFPNLALLWLTNNNLTQLNLTGLSNLVSVNCSMNQIASVSVNGLTSLQTLNFYSNNVTSLTVTNCPAVENLECMSNSLQSLDLTSFPALKNLYCNFNQISELDLSVVPLLESLYCDGNQLTSLDLSVVPHLTDLLCRSNAITSLDVSGLPQLDTFWCDQNPISSLDVSNNPLLNNFSCSGLAITSLDISQNPAICSLACMDNPALTTLNLKNGNASAACNQFYGLSELPNLEYVCTDDDEMDFFNDYFAANQMTGISVNTYCTFTPGGDYNTITGTIRFDGNNNGCDALDATQPLVKVRLNSAEGNAVTFTDAVGNYTFYTGAGNYVISAAPEVIPYYNPVLPAEVNFPIVDGSVETKNFCITANGIHSDAEVVMAPINPAQPGFFANYVITFRNKGNQVLTGSVHLNFNDNALDFVSASVPGTQSVGSLTFSYATLQPFESRSIYVTFEVNSPTDNPPVNIGDVLNFTAFISHGGVEETGADNEFHYSETVTGSFDPNNVICIEGETASTEAIGDYLHYIVNFENTGNAAAQNIVVHQNINPADFDIESLQVLNSSHPVVVRVVNGVCEFIFNGINLGSGGHGNILMKIRSVPTLNTGDSVASQADIYFDYNFPVATNLATTTFTTLSINDPVADASLRAYPNPTGGIVTISANDDIKRLQLYDVQGRLLQTSLEHQKVINIDVSDRPGGIYFIKVTTAAGTTTIKMIRS